MYAILLFLPLIGFLSTIMLSRFVSKKFILYLNIASLICAILIGLNVFIEVVICGSPIVVELVN